TATRPLSYSVTSTTWARTTACAALTRAPTCAACASAREAPAIDHSNVESAAHAIAATRAPPGCGARGDADFNVTELINSCLTHHHGTIESPGALHPPPSTSTYSGLVKASAVMPPSPRFPSVKSDSILLLPVFKSFGTTGNSGFETLSVPFTSTTT